MSKKIHSIRVNRDLCIGAASCLAALAEDLELDTEDKAVIIKKDGTKTSDTTLVSDIREQDNDVIKMSAESCPTQAILLYDEDGKQIFP